MWTTFGFAMLAVARDIFSAASERTPSGIITAKAVPTNSPAPKTVIRFSFS